jgi:hypothetical protein
VRTSTTWINGCEHDYFAATHSLFMTFFRHWIRTMEELLGHRRDWQHPIATRLELLSKLISQRGAFYAPTTAPNPSPARYWPG